MKMEMVVADFIEAAGIAGGVCGGKYKGPLPTDHIMICAEGKEVRLTATDLETYIRVSKPADVDKAGEVTIPYRRLMDILKTLPKGGKIRIDAKEDATREKYKTKIECGPFRFTVSGGKPQDYPAFPEMSEKQAFLAKERSLYGMFSRTAVALGKDPERAVLQGMYMSIRRGEFILAGCDGKRASYTARPVADHVIDAQGIFPADAISRFMSVAEDEGEAEVEIGFSENHASFTLRNVKIVSRLLEGTYPDITKVIPIVPVGSGAAKIEVSRNSFVTAVDAASVSAAGDLKRVDLMIVDNEMELESRDDSVSSAHVTLAVKYEGAPVRIALNCKYLSDIIYSHVGDAVVLIPSADSKDPLLIKTPDDPYFSHVIMPLKS
jgi:DNA polymerase-3 subunit beta